jgi:oxygen-independent coproporphyrinogen III oxidase
MSESGLYIHIPFCDHKCIYCDFYSIITSDNIPSFFTSLKREIDYYSAKYSNDHLFTSVFFGGGTPSLMAPLDLEDILSYAKKRFSISADAEITMETNPGTVTPEKLNHFLEAGINRISIGIQSFDDNDLKFLTRIHDKQTAKETVCNAAEAGFKNISIDLIFNLPGQSKEKWLKNLSQAVSLPINHISTYSLILERGTILSKLVLDGIVKMQDDDYDADLYELTIDFLTSRGFQQYEVSNFAKKGYECLHNKAYWHYRDYLGLGPSSHSFMNGKRWWNYSSLKRYISEIDIKEYAEAGQEFPSPHQKLDEYVMLALRSSGLNLEYLRDKFGGEWFNKNSAFISETVNAGFIIREGDVLKLTASGYAVCDEIIAKFLL